RPGDCYLHRRAVLRAAPGEILRGVAAGAGVAAYELGSARRRLWPLPGAMEPENKGQERENRAEREREPDHCADTLVSAPTRFNGGSRRICAPSRRHSI